MQMTTRQKRLLKRDLKTLTELARVTAASGMAEEDAEEHEAVIDRTHETLLMLIREVEAL